MLTGLWDIGKMVIDTIKSLLDGSLFSSISDIYDSIKNMTAEQALDMVKSVLNMAKDAGQDFLVSWNHGDPYQQWFFKGKIVGTIVTEIVLAIVTAGASLGEQVIAKLGKYFPKLARVGGKLLTLGDKLPGMGGKKKPGADLPDGHGTPGGQHLPDVNDSDAMDWSTKLGMARMITELHDQVDTPVGVLIPLLNSTIATKSQVVNGYRAEMTGPGVYDIVQFTKKKHDPAKVKEGFTTGKEEEKDLGPLPVLPDKIIHQDRTMRIWHNYGNINGSPGSPIEHAPIHFHVTYKNREYRAFPSGKALRDSEPLPEEVMAFFRSNKDRFYEIERGIGKWFWAVKQRGWTNR